MVLKVDSISKNYCSNGSAKLTVLQSISLTIESNTVLGIVGPNGSGKTTLLRIIAGLESPDTGDVSFPHGLNRRDISFVFQDYSSSLFPWLTGYENLSFPLYSNSNDESSASIRDRVDRVMSELNIKLNLSQYPYELSGGQRQLLGLARAFMIDPRLMILDEPFSSLDVPNTLRTAASLTSMLSQKSRSTVIVSHDIDPLLYLSDEVLVLSPRPASIYDRVKVPSHQGDMKSFLAESRVAEIRAEILTYLKELHGSEH